MNTNKKYLQNIADRMLDYDAVRNEVSAYILEKNIESLDLMTDLLISGFLWKANLRDEVLTEADIEIFLGNDEEIEYEDNLEYILEEDWTRYSLEELLDIVCEKSDYC